MIRRLHSFGNYKMTAPGGLTPIFIFILAVSGFVCCMEFSHAASASLSPSDRLYLTHRPPVGEVYVVDIRDEPFERKILAASLQGIVNKKRARIFLVDGTPGKNRPWETTTERDSAFFWLELYQKRYGIKKVWEGNLNEALKKFAKEAKGYILVSKDEPWTINAGTTLASVKNALAAFEPEQELMESLGLKIVDSLPGRWKNLSDCYNDLYQQFYPRMKHRGVAILSPEEYRLRDFVIQQGILTIYARPTTEGWDTVKDILKKLPENIPVFGYLALTGEEEFWGVKTLSENGKYLIPTDTTPNLSFHVSVVPMQTKKLIPLQTEKKQCSKDNLNVTVAISDGDNLAIPLNRYAWSAFWQSPLRGELPVGWSLSLALFSLAPAVADYYVSSATSKDELIAMLGIGYALSFYYKDTDFFLSSTFKLMKEKNLKTYWILDVPLYNRQSKFWGHFSRSSTDGFPSGVLLGYAALGNVKFFRTEEGLPVLIAASSYPDKPEILAKHVRSILTLHGAPRPPVVFLSAAAWSNPLEELVAALKPLKSEGVNFLLPSEAFGCVP